MLPSYACASTRIAADVLHGDNANTLMMAGEQGGQAEKGRDNVSNITAVFFPMNRIQ
jgi:hypothetical protein